MFDIGKLVCTRTVFKLSQENEDFAKFLQASYKRYLAEDWGDTCKEDARQNDEAVKSGERILAVYKFPRAFSWNANGEDAIWIITEWDRSVTTILFPGEY